MSLSTVSRFDLLQNSWTRKHIDASGHMITVKVLILIGPIKWRLIDSGIAVCGTTKQ